MRTLDSFLHLIDRVSDKGNLSHDHQKLLRDLRRALDQRQREPDVAVPLQIFIDSYHRAVATNGSRNGVFLMRNEGLRNHWRNVWLSVEADIGGRHYCGTDHVADYIFSVILKSSSILPSLTTAYDETANNSDVGVYADLVNESIEPATDDSKQKNVIRMNTASCVGAATAASMANVTTPVVTAMPEIPFPLRQRYYDQAAYCFGKLEKKLSGNLSCSSDRGSSLLAIYSIIPKLASRTVVTGQTSGLTISEEFMRMLYIIDQRAIGSVVANARSSLDQLKAFLGGDISLIDDIYHLLMLIHEESTRSQAETLLQLFVEVGCKSIWKTFCEYGGYNERSNRNVSFRTEVQMAHASGRKRL